MFHGARQGTNITVTRIKEQPQPFSARDTRPAPWQAIIVKCLDGAEYLLPPSTNVLQRGIACGRYLLNVQQEQQRRLSAATATTAT